MPRSLYTLIAEPKNLGKWKLAARTRPPTQAIDPPRAPTPRRGSVASALILWNEISTLVLFTSSVDHLGEPLGRRHAVGRLDFLHPGLERVYKECSCSCGTVLVSPSLALRTTCRVPSAPTVSVLISPTRPLMIFRGWRPCRWRSRSRLVYSSLAHRHFG